MRYSFDFLTLEFRRSARNIFLWIAPILIFYTIYNDTSHFIGKKGYTWSELIQNGTLTVSQEMIARSVIFTLSSMLLLSIFIFANYFSIFMDNRYSEITLSKSIKTTRLVGYKLTASYWAVILISFMATFISTWVCLHNYQLPFEPLYFSSLYLIYLVIPLLLWLLLSFSLAVLVSDVKIFYPIMFILWFANLFPSKYALGYSNWREINLANPLGDIGLMGNRTAYLVLAVFILMIGIKLLEDKRKDIFKSNASRKMKSGDGTNVYHYRGSYLTKLLTSYKVNLSWKCIFGIIMFAILPPLLNQLLPHVFNSMLNTTEIVMKILRTGEIYLSLAVLLYASYFLNIESLYNTSEIITCRPGGTRKTNHDKRQLLFLFTIVMLLVFYFSIYLFVDHLSLVTYTKIILPEIMLYLMLPFAAITLIRNRIMALVICYLLWTFNLLEGLQLPIFINTFAPIQFINTLGYNINRIELIVITIILWALSSSRQGICAPSVPPRTDYFRSSN